MTVDGKPQGRPRLRRERLEEFRRAVYERQLGPDGKLHEPYEPYRAIDWKPGDPVDGVVDFGHVENEEYRLVFREYRDGIISLEQLEEHEFNPDNFQIEFPHENRSHRHEAG